MGSFYNVSYNRLFFMKRVLIWSLVVIIASLATFLAFGITGKIHNTNIAKEKIKTLPSFSFKKLNDTVYNSNQIKEGPLLILFFHPECEHCQYQITSLFKKWIQPRDMLVLLVSNAEKSEIRNFIKENNIPDSLGLIVLVDEANNFIDYFGTERVPSTFIYNKQLQLIKYFQGEVRPETILKYLKQDD
jgi:peroxiredoxin